MENKIIIICFNCHALNCKSAVFSWDIFDQILMRFLFTENIIPFVPCGVDGSQRTKKCLGWNLHEGRMSCSFHITPSLIPHAQPLLCPSLYNKICWTMSWMRSEPSFHSNKPFYLRPATYITMQDKKKVEQNEAEVLRWEEANREVFILESQKQLLFDDGSTLPALYNRQEALLTFSYICKNSERCRLGLICSLIFLPCACKFSIATAYMEFVFLRSQLDYRASCTSKVNTDLFF